jgi:hypothetical protein
MLEYVKSIQAENIYCLITRHFNGSYTVYSHKLYTKPKDGVVIGTFSVYADYCPIQGVEYDNVLVEFFKEYNDF